MTPQPSPIPDPSVLCLKMQPRWGFIDDLRRFTESFCAAACPGAEREGQLALAVHELVQNALANGTAPDVELELAIDARSERVGVAVTNRCAPEQLERLRARLARLYRDADPLEAYLRTMDEERGAHGGLGLARVRYEAALDLTVTAEGDRVTVHASGALHPPVAAAAN
jgi:anti-sigma regulatory factor (Ser/Thr protein kinase)